MANEIISPDIWEAIRLSSIKGVPDSELADRFGVTRQAIRKRRSRDDIWSAAYTPPIGSPGSKSTNFEPESQGVTEGSGDCLPAVSPVPAVTLAQKVASTVQENIASLAENNRLLALQLASKGLKKADHSLPDIATWADVKTIYEISHKASGLDSGNSVQVNVLANGGCEFIPSSVENMGI